jgi:hypothetical protein
LTVTKLAILGFFSAMRSCKEAIPLMPVPHARRSFVLAASYSVATRNGTAHEGIHPGIRIVKTHVTTVFVEMKNCAKMDRRTQRQTPHIDICLARHAASLVQPIRRQVLGFDGTTSVNTVQMEDERVCLTQEFLRRQLHATCIPCGGKAKFGFDSTEIGSGLLRSGAATDLFLKHSSERITILEQEIQGLHGVHPPQSPGMNI